MAHMQIGLPALFAGTPEAIKALSEQNVAYGSWDTRDRRFTIQVHPPGLQ